MSRLFVAVEISETARDRAVEVINHLAQSGADVKWVSRENLHLTLKFLGEVPPEEVEKVCRTVVVAVQEVAPFEFELVGAGAFPSLQRATTLWLGVGDGTKEVDRLFRAIQRPLVGLGIPREDRKFTPHLTLGRLKRGVRPPRELGEHLQRHSQFIAGRSLVSEVVVFESQLRPAGPIYHALCRAPLASRE